MEAGSFFASTTTNFDEPRRMFGTNSKLFDVGAALKQLATRGEVTFTEAEKRSMAPAPDAKGKKRKGPAAAKAPQKQKVCAPSESQKQKVCAPAAAAVPAVRQKKRKPARDAAAGELPEQLPFSCDAADHAETPLAAYEDVAPILRGLARSLAKSPAALKIWDPFFCTGSAAKRLAAVGFPSVHHRCEDFYGLLASGRAPEHDVLVTNPPYSSEHLRDLFAHCQSSGKPWALLLPWFVVRRPWFRAHADTHTVQYLCSRRRYFYLPPPAMVAEGRDRVTAPFETFWYLSLGPAQREIAISSQREIADGWRAERSAEGEEAGGAEAAEAGPRCRLGVGFKKRRGTPGFHTLLDENGLLAHEVRLLAPKS